MPKTLTNSKKNPLPRPLPEYKEREKVADAPSWRRLIEPLASLKLTVVLLGLGMILIFAGTTIQTDMGIWDVQRRYFHSWFTFIEWRLFFPLWDWGRENVPGSIPFPGGFTIIALLLINLLAAHTLRFKVNWKRSGILLIHSGLILLLIGEFVTAKNAVESQMIIANGQSTNFSQDSREVELAITDPSPADHDNEVIIPIGRLKLGGTVQDPTLPFAIRIDGYYPNSDIAGPMQTNVQGQSLATTGAGVGLKLLALAPSSGTESKIDEPSAFITPIGPDGHPIGTYLTSTIPLEQPFPQISIPQMVKVDGKEYWLQLRYRRSYKPYTMHLIKFSHDRYTGTDKPKNFSSLVRLVDPSQNVDREILIWMNHPLRYAGETFYQADFDHERDQYTILQVVHNPGWLIPYISCSMVGLGLLIHFGMHLIKFLRQRAGAERSPAKRNSGSVVKTPWLPAALITGFCGIYLLGLAFPASSSDAYNIDSFARIPVSYEGRTMPLDSLARNSLRIMSGKSEVTLDDGQKMPAINWLLEAFNPYSDRVLDYHVIDITNPEVLNLLGLKESWVRTSTMSSLIGMDERRRFTPAEVLTDDNIKKLKAQFKLANDVDAKKRDLYQHKILDLVEQLSLFNQLRGAGSLYLSPPLVNSDWRQLGDVMKAVEDDKAHDPGAESFVGMIQAYGDHQSAEFNSLGSAYHNLIAQKMPDASRKLDLEVLFNRTEPFIQCMVLYVIVFIFAAVSWLKWHGAMARAALWLLALTLAFHTFGLVARVYIQGRPPVTNLYSSAIFIAWGAVVFCVGLELIFRNAIASAAAAAIAFPSLLIAHYLAGSGDTMQMLQAVLDTNIWLATHVVVVTLGYTATFLAGFLGIIYIVRGVFTKGGAVTNQVPIPHGVKSALVAGSVVDLKTLYRMIYGIVCFAMLFSFVGTILGGIWADQSWGRFWGWDPKENGAVLIVLWNAIILHARWGGLVRERGVAVLAVIGNIVTSWSWFGTNMLGVGLHSYGFMDSAGFWLMAFVGVQVSIALLGSLPTSVWRSFSGGKAALA